MWCVENFNVTRIHPVVLKKILDWGREKTEHNAWR